MKFLNRKMVGACMIAAAGAFNASIATAGIILFNGGLFEVSVDNIAGDTADFVYTADFTNWNTQWDSNYIIAVDFKLSGYTIEDVTDFSTTAAGTWAAGSAQNSNANGCKFGDNKTFACAGDLADPFTEATGQETVGIVTWNFTVEFDKAIVEADLVAENTNHIGAFFKKCRDSDGKCNGGNGLSVPTTFNPPGGGGPPQQVPVPGTLFLLGLGLLALRFRFRA